MFKKWICQNRNWVFQNFPFLENDFDALTDYELFCKMVEYAKSLLITNEKFLSELKNNLDEMYNDGKFDSLIMEIINLQTTFTFDSLSDMKNATNLVDGSYARTSGFYSYNDDGGAYYKIREITNNDVIDEINIYALENPLLVAELIKPLIIKPEIFGAYGDGINNDTTAFNKMLSYVYNLESDNSDWEKTLPMICENTYKIDEVIIPSGMQQITMDGNNKGTFTDGGFTFNEGCGWHTYIKNLIFKNCENPLDFKYYNIEYGKIIVENCTFNNCTGVCLNIKRRSHQVFIRDNRFSYNEKTCYAEDVDMLYFERNYIEIDDIWENNHYEIEQKATYEGTMFIKENLFVPAVEQVNSNLAWIKVGRNANIEGNRFSGEHEGIHPILISYDEFSTFNPLDKYVYPIINFINNPIVAGTGSILLDKACGQLNIHNNSFTKIAPCIEVIDDTVFNNLDFNKLYISINDNTGKIFNFREYGWSKTVDDNVAPIVPLCLQKFIKKYNLFAVNSNENYETQVNDNTLTIKLNTNLLSRTSYLQFLVYGSINPNPTGSSSYFENFTAILTLKRDYDGSNICVIPEVILLTNNSDYQFALTPLINGVSKIETSSDIMSNNIELSVTYSGEFNDATVRFKGFLPLELIPVFDTNVYYGNDWATNN